MNTTIFSVCFLSVISVLVIDVITPTIAAPTDEIIVTARLREENLQEVPLSITALSAEELENARISNVDALDMPRVQLAALDTMRRSPKKEGVPH
jgi:outer membrane receptor for ferrienterochelin and colicin